MQVKVKRNDTRNQDTKMPVTVQEMSVPRNSRATKVPELNASF